MKFCGFETTPKNKKICHEFTNNFKILNTTNQCYIYHP